MKNATNTANTTDDLRDGWNIFGDEDDHLGALVEDGQIVRVSCDADDATGPSAAEAALRNRGYRVSSAGWDVEEDRAIARVFRSGTQPEENNMSNTTNTATLRISRDLSVYGEAATAEDRDAFGENLAAHLAAKFGMDVHVVFTDGGASSDNAEIHAEVRRIVESDDWTQFLS